MRVRLRFAALLEDEILFVSSASFSGEYLISAVGIAEYGSIGLDCAIDLLCHDFWDMGYFPVETSFKKFLLEAGKCCRFNAETERLLDFNHVMQPYTLISDRCLLMIRDPSVTISQMLSFGSSAEEVDLIFAFTAEAGEVWRDSKSQCGDDGVHYNFHSGERSRHKLPHVHVRYKHEGSASISISDGSVLAQDGGRFPGKCLRAAQKRVIENKEELLGYWNKMTDGLSADPDFLLGKKTIASK